MDKALSYGAERFGFDPRKVQTIFNRPEELSWKTFGEKKKKEKSEILACVPALTVLAASKNNQISKTNVREYIKLRNNVHSEK